MPTSFGYRARTRDMFSRKFRKHGPEKLSTYLTQYKVGDYVDVVANPAQQKGMPHKGYHGKTGVVWNVTPHAVGVEINKQVRQRIIRKRIHVRVEHVRKSKCRDAYLAQVAANEAQKQAFKAGNAEWKPCKREATGTPRAAALIKASKRVITVGPSKYTGY